MRRKRMRRRVSEGTHHYGGERADSHDGASQWKGSQQRVEKGEGTWDRRDWVKGRAADAKDLVLSTKSCSDPITSLGLMMSQSSMTGPTEKENIDSTTPETD